MTRPPRAGARWWRRRFLVIAVVIVLAWIASGVLFGIFGDDERRGPDERGGPAPVVLAFVGVAVLATVVAYRRLAGPTSELLDAAERLGGGDLQARVNPAGPRSVRTLGTAFNEMAARLDAAETSRRRFLADVTHELRTPLTVLQAEIDAQLDGIHPRDEDHLVLLRDQTRTLDRLVEDLRTLALGDAGQLALHRESVSARVMATDAAAAIATAAAGRDVTVRVDGDDAELDADPVRLTQVLTNLLTNAVRHTPPSGTVTVGITVTATDVVFSVSDTGTGISGDPERIFDRFAKSADSGGSGLGLSIARQLVERHGGTLTAVNDPSGGARFTATLPIGPRLAS